MEREDFHRGFRVGIVGRFESQLTKTQVGEEGTNNSLQVTQIQPVISEYALDLMKLRQVCGIQSLISEDSINTEVALGCELFLREESESKLLKGLNKSTL